jgi:hypothetical protein
MALSSVQECSKDMESGGLEITDAVQENASNICGINDLHPEVKPI